MFRSKKKKAGTAVRKRKDLDEDDEQGAISIELVKSDPMDMDGAETEVLEEPSSPQNDPGQRVGGDVEEEEEAMLERMRSRLQKSKGKSTISMSFSSRASAVKKTKRAPVANEDGEDDGLVAGATTATGCLSFEKEQDKSSKKKSKLRIRPNLSVAQTIPEADEDDKVTNPYSEDMMAALLREQKVLLRRSVPEQEENKQVIGDDAMEVDEEDARRYATLDEEMNGEDDSGASAEEFIPLNARLLKTKKNKKRVTFGVHNDEFYPAKTAQVEEPLSASEYEDGDEEADQTKRWEEELMRRGGHHVQQQPLRAASSRGYDSKLTYPTRKSVPCASLGEVMRNIQRKLDTGLIERDRVSRELAQLDAETGLIQSKLGDQREELLVCSEQFEYFQVVEDFVKGLSFCLREKLSEIELEERKRASSWLASAQAARSQRDSDINAEIWFCLAGNTIQERHFANLPPQASDVNGCTGDPSDQKLEHDTRLTRFRQRYEITPSPAQVSSEWDVFADVVDEFSSLSNVYGRFQEWKAKFPDVYKNAYCNLAQSKLYAPYIRAELIDWDPIRTVPGIRAAALSHRLLSEMEWFKTLSLHRGHLEHDLEEPVPSLLREILVARVEDATKNRFDPFSSAQVQSVVAFIEDLAHLHAIKYVEHGVQVVVTNVLTAFTNEAKRLPLLALNEQEASVDRAREFAAFLVGEFCSLLENALTFFVTLPSGAFHQQGFNAIMQLLHQLLAYVNHCQHHHKTTMLSQVNSTLQQLSASSFMQSILARSTREQFEFQRVLHLLTSATLNPAT